MRWKITFINTKAEQEAMSFPAGVLAHFLHILELIEEFGPTLGRPHTAPMGSGLFEIRAKGREGIGRALFCTSSAREVIILHAFVKKTQRTPIAALGIARRRMREVG